MKPTRSANRTVATRRSSGTVDERVPAGRAEARLRGTVAPHAGQVTPRSLRGGSDSETVRSGCVRIRPVGPPRLARPAARGRQWRRGRAKLSDAEIDQGLADLPGWSREGDQIVKTYELPTFPATIEFVGRIAERAEAANHHPDLDIRYRRLRVALSTHDDGGITQKDVDLANQIEAAVPDA